MTFMEWLEALSYVVTIVGLPGAVFSFCTNSENTARMN